jgi:putative redox protein
MKGMVRLVEGMQFVAETDSGFSMVLDGAEKVGGRDSGPRPFELLLVSLAGCTAMDVLSILRKKRVKVAGIEVHTDGERTEEHPRVPSDINIRYRIFGVDVKAKDVERAIELSEEKYCGVQAILRPTAKIASSYEIVEVTNTEIYKNSN